MIGSSLYLISESRFASLEPNIDSFDEEFEAHEVERLDFGYWELFAYELAKTSVIGKVLFTGESEGWFVFEWSPVFVTALLDSQSSEVRRAVSVLLSENSSAGMSESAIIHECERLLALFTKARENNLSVVEVSAA